MGLKTEHRGFEITYCEFDDRWDGKLDDISISTKQGLAELKKKIDAALKKESKFKNMAVIVEGRWGGNQSPFRKVTITSINEKGECWVKTARGIREKLYESDVLYADNKANLGIISEMARKDDEAKAISQEKENLQETLQTVTIPK